MAVSFFAGVEVWVKHMPAGCKVKHVLNPRAEIRLSWKHMTFRAEYR